MYFCTNLYQWSPEVSLLIALYRSYIQTTTRSVMVISVGRVLSTFAVEGRGAGIFEGYEVFFIEE